MILKLRKIKINRRIKYYKKLNKLIKLIIIISSNSFVIILNSLRIFLIILYKEIYK